MTAEPPAAEPPTSEPPTFNVRTIGPEPSGATPLEEEDLDGLIPDFVATRADLNQVEFENIAKAVPWATTHPHGCNWRRRAESNRRTGLCRPLPKPLGHAAGRRSAYRPATRSGF